MHSPLISVIIPTYNRSALLKIALESVFAQTENNYEVIVVDDGSTDNTEEVVRSFRSVKYLRIANSGPARARNIGIQASRGEFIAFLDSDDCWDPDKLKVQLDEFQKAPEIVMVYSNYRNIDLEGRRLREPAIQTSLEGAVYSSVQAIIEGDLPCATDTVMVRRCTFDEIGLFDEFYKIGEDFDMWVRLALLGEVRFINMPLMSVRLHDAHLSRSLRSEVWRPVVEIIKKHERILKAKGLSSQRYLSKFSLLTARAFLLEGKRGMALKYYFYALVNTPINFLVYKGIVKCLLPVYFSNRELIRDATDEQKIFKQYY